PSLHVALPILTSMILDRALKGMARLTAQVRGRGRVLIGGGDPVETQGAFVTVAEIKKRVGTLPPDGLERVRFAPEPEWRKMLRGEPETGADAAAESGEDGRQSDDKADTKRPSSPRDSGPVPEREGDQDSSDSEPEDNDGKGPDSDPADDLD